MRSSGEAAKRKPALRIARDVRAYCSLTARARAGRGISEGLCSGGGRLRELNSKCLCTERLGHHAVDHEPEVNVMRREIDEVLLAEERGELPGDVLSVLSAEAKGDDRPDGTKNRLAHRG